jgi:hypothetical protein
VTCAFCNAPVDPANCYRRIVAWEKKSLLPSRRGGADVVLREHQPEFACTSCVGRLRDGLSVEQGSLL